MHGVFVQKKKDISILFTWLDIYRQDIKVGRFLSVLAMFGVSYGLYRGIQDNYLAEIAKITAFERGIVEFFRELPGLLLIFILAFMYRFSVSKIFKIGIAIMAAGLAGLLIGGTGKIMVVLFMVMFSLGEHIIMPVRTTISMNFARQEKLGASLGITSAISHLGNILGFIMVAVLFSFFSRAGFGRGDIFPFKTTLGIALAIMLGAVLVVMALKETEIKKERRRFYFAKKFNIYYILEIFYGARKQVFLTFAPYVLILKYHANTSTISMLLAICAVFGLLFSPIMGRLIDKLGFKFIMVTDTLLLIVVCILYGFAHRIFPMHIAFIVVCVNYVLDSIISLGSMATNVYVKNISSSQEEITATLSTGLSVNHAISVFIALMGGWIWKVTGGIEVLFSISAFLGLLNSIFAATIKVRQPASGFICVPRS